MSDTEIKVNKMKMIVKALNKYRDAYYNRSESLISDKEYDDLYDKLQELENETGVIMSNSPIHSVGYEVKSELKKIKHSHVMLSLDKTKKVEDLKKFQGYQDCLLMAKMDGLTILATYEDGKLIQAETRGDGDIGEIVTHNAKVFDNIPLEIDLKGHVEIEGEAIITYNDFNTINNTIKDKKYKNPRNLASGSVRQLDSKIAAGRHLKFVVWKVPAGMEHLKTMVERFNKAAELGFDVVPYMFCDPECIERFIEYLKEEVNELSYPIDGLVITYNDINYGLSLGVTDKFPRHSLAFKFYDDLYETKDLEKNEQLQKETVESLEAELNDLKAEKDNAIFTLSTAQVTQSLQANPGTSSNEEDKMLERVRDGIQKKKEEADGNRIMYENSTQVQKQRLEKKIKDDEIDRKLQELKAKKGR